MGLFKKKRNKMKGFHGMKDEYDDDSFTNPDLSLEATTTATTSSNSSPRDVQNQSHYNGDVTSIQNNSHGHEHISQDIDNNIEVESTATDAENMNLDQLPALVQILSTCTSTYSEAPARALRILFALSEHHTFHEINRIRMVREAEAKLVPVLLEFLQRCKNGSSEQYLALLVLNNVSIPSENKRLVALEYEGARILGRMLCGYPESSLLCIILVNLSFCDGALRMILVGSHGGEEIERVYLMEAFAYALQISTMEEGEEIPIQNTVTADKQNNETPLELLTKLQHALRTHAKSENKSNRRLLKMAHPETAKWCMCGMKNLTRPSRDPIAAQALIDSGVLGVLLKVLDDGNSDGKESDGFGSNEFGRDDDQCDNNPYTWDSNSTQDAALYILMNLALTPVTRPHLRNDNVARRISLIAKYSSSPILPNQGDGENDQGALNGEKQKNLQCLKARMILAYLFGSEGHFGQMAMIIPPSSSPMTKNRNLNHRLQKHMQSQIGHQDDLLIKGSEAPLLVQLLANTLHSRGKSGAGGYNATTFNAKKALYAIRCLLTNPLNVKTFFVTCGSKLNVLLLKSLAFHSIEDVPNVDFEAAEDACFSLFMLSNHGFMGPFLPPDYPFENILYCYSRKKTCTSAGKHAATQLLLRHPYLQMNGSLEEDEPKDMLDSDLELGLLHAAAENIDVFENAVGVEPMDDIFGRPVTRKRFMVSDDVGPSVAAAGGKLPTPWEWESNNNSNISSFNSALEAVQDLSFGSKYCDNSNSFIDEIAIANNIARCANGENGETYGFEWTWQDGEGGDGGELKESDVRKRLNDFRAGRIDSFKGLFKNRVKERPSEPITIFGINCGCNSVILD